MRRLPAHWAYGLAVLAAGACILGGWLLDRSQDRAVEEWCDAHGGHIESPQQIGRVCIVDRTAP